jgi:hypothetical protein
MVASPRTRQSQYSSQLLGVESAAHRKFFNEFNDQDAGDCRQK